MRFERERIYVCDDKVDPDEDEIMRHGEPAYHRHDGRNTVHVQSTSQCRATTGLSIPRNPYSNVYNINKLMTRFTPKKCELECSERSDVA
jgi:hypothetical protein